MCRVVSWRMSALAFGRFLELGELAGVWKCGTLVWWDDISPVLNSHVRMMMFVKRWVQ